MWTQPITIIKNAADADVASYNLFRNGTLVKQGSWPVGQESITVQDTVPDDGSYSWHATLSDEVPNESGTSAAQTVVLDHNAPVVTLGDLPAQVTNLERFMVTASAVDNLGGPVTMRATFGPTPLQELEPGVWEANPAGMPPGTYQVVVFAQDQNGLEGQASGGVEVITPVAQVTVGLLPGVTANVNGLWIVG